MANEISDMEMTSHHFNWGTLTVLTALDFEYDSYHSILKPLGL